MVRLNASANVDYLDRRISRPNFRNEAFFDTRISVDPYLNGVVCHHITKALRHAHWRNSLA